MIKDSILHIIPMTSEMQKRKPHGSTASCPESSFCFGLHSQTSSPDVTMPSQRSPYCWSVIT